MKNVKRDENSPVEIIEGRLKILRTNEIDARIEAQTPGIKRVGGRKKNDNLEGENRRIALKRKRRLKSLRKESKDFARVGWILDYGLRFREEEGRAGGKRKQLRIDLAKDKEVQISLTRNAPDKRGWTTNEN